MIGTGCMSQIDPLANYVEIKDCEVVSLTEMRLSFRENL
jgi:hypothetical protein